jgi:hypothetical protein
MTKKRLFSVALLGLGLRSILAFVYTFYTKIHNIAERIILPCILPNFYLLLSKVFVFLCRKCRKGLYPKPTQATLHFVLSVESVENTLYPLLALATLHIPLNRTLKNIYI